MKRMDLLLPCFLGDIASDLSQHASQVYLSTRRGCYMIKRLTPGTTVPFDHQLSRAESFVNKYFKRSLMADWVNKYRLFWGNEGICDLFTEARSAEVNKHISPRCLKITYLFFTLRGRVNESK